MEGHWFVLPTPTSNVCSTRRPPPPSGALGHREGLQLAESVKSTFVPNAVIWTSHSHPFPTSAIF